jgi:hypothetical protein
VARHDCGVTVADDHLARIESALDDGDREDGASASHSDEGRPDCAGDDLALREALQPIIGIILKLGAGPAPGAGGPPDASWAASVALARRNILAHQAGGIDHGVAGETLRLLDRIDSMTGVWPDEDWDDLARRLVQELVDAGRRGRQRGRALSASRRHTEPEAHIDIGWLLRHPTDHYLRWVAGTVTDPRCRAPIEVLIAKLAPSYQGVCGLSWTEEEAAAEVVVEVQVLDGQAGRWTTPASAIVTTPIKGDVSLGEQIAVRLVEDNDAPFNGTLVSLLAGEQWLICARVLNDGTLLPLDGTRRCATPPG